MKKASKLLWVLLTLVLAAVLVIGCDNGTTEKKPPVYKEAQGKVTDWSIIRRAGNTFGLENFVISEVTEGTGKVLKATWGDSSPWVTTEIWANLPSQLPYQDYDGVTFDVKVSATNNFLFVIRNTGEANAWKLAEEYIEKGDEGEAWVTVKIDFSSAVDPGWGTAFTQANLKDWLEANKNSSTAKRLYINPLLNAGGPGGAVDTLNTVYLKNIGFYKGPKAAPTSTFIVWKF